MNDISSKRILVTGCCGTIGRALVRQLVCDLSPQAVIGLDNNESELFFLERQYPDSPASFYLGDVRDVERLTSLMRQVDVVFHTAAFKHVFLCERSPEGAIHNNVLGVENVITAATRAGIETVIFTSSDKAVNPTSVMGASKLLGEKLFSAANMLSSGDGPKFSTTRFGNVLGSRGSVIPVFRKQIAAGGPVTLTHPDMTRFIMSVDQAVRLVIDTASLAKGGEVFITKMPVIRIPDLAEVMRDSLAPLYGLDPRDIPIEVVGPRPGEKLYEELMNTEEVRRSIELEKYFLLVPALDNRANDVIYDYPGSLGKGVELPYNSANVPVMSKEELRKMLAESGLLDRAATSATECEQCES
ncbi:polysaccharide biosynthesis protein [Pseudodesulfovibrio karagichevae]|uniref:Polysaccharide biosynthesis protein n=1 Tax=Pseudodesulfovibrio karagichevae TaxID=3239305 RepID=A0ABV4K580_9BACT